MQLNANNKSYKFIKDIVIAVLVVLFVRSFIVQLSLVPSGSMKPTLVEGDFTLVTKYNYGYSRYSLPFNLPILPNRLFYHEPTRGDVFVFKNPQNPSVEYVKRLIAKGGDTVEMINSVVYINGVALTRDYLETVTDKGVSYTVYTEHGSNKNYKVWQLENPYNIYSPADVYSLNNFGPVVVPQDSFFALGDNRNNSQDSRFIGFIKKELLVGKPSVIILSIGYAPLLQFYKWITEIKVDRFFKIIN